MAKSRVPKTEVNDLVKLRRHVAILADIGRLSVAADTEKFLDQVVVQVARAVEIDHVKFLLYRQATSDFIVAAGYGWHKGVVGTTTLSADLRSPAGRAFQTALPVSAADLMTSEFECPAMLLDHGIVSVCNVPVFAEGMAAGVLEVDSTTRCEFTQDTTDFLLAVGGIVGSTLQKRAAARAETAARGATAMMEANHQDLLLRELQHRVKNNFQFILASIAIQRRRFKGAETRRALTHVESRIHAISLAHDQLEPRQGQAIRLDSYLRALCDSLEQQSESITIELGLDEIDLAIDRAVPVGLILNELVTNSIKYAFAGRGGGRIGVQLIGGLLYGEARLTVTDDGVGIKADAVPGSGTGLIESLARQIGGTAVREPTDKGAAFSLTFPVIV
jgi:two-component sensor histidine kinase